MSTSEELALRGQNWHEPRALTDEEKEQFLAYVREHQDCSIREASEAVGLHRADVKLTRRTVSDFDHDYREARGYGEEQVVNQMRRLAIEGVEEPLVSAGKIVGYKKVYSERLLGLMYQSLTAEGKAMMANKLGIEISGPDGGPVVVQRGISFDEVAQVLRAAGKANELEAPEGTAEIVSEEDE